MSSDAARRAATAAAVEAVWQRMRPTVLERFTSLERALEAACGEGIGGELREQAGLEAHKLAGSLGSFGFPEGSDLARELESALKDGLEAEAAARYAERLRALKERLSA